MKPEPLLTAKGRRLLVQIRRNYMRPSLNGLCPDCKHLLPDQSRASRNHHDRECLRVALDDLLAGRNGYTEPDALARAAQETPRGR